MTAPLSLTRPVATSHRSSCAGAWIFFQDCGERSATKVLPSAELRGRNLRKHGQQNIRSMQGDGVTPMPDALAHAHERDVFHRDVEPANNLIAEDDTTNSPPSASARFAARSVPETTPPGDAEPRRPTTRSNRFTLVNRLMIKTGEIQPNGLSY